MNVTCSECETQFRIPSDLSIGKEGRWLQCSECGYQWHYQFVEEKSVEPVKVPQPVSTKKSTSALTVKRPRFKKKANGLKVILRQVAVASIGIGVIWAGYNERAVLSYLPFLDPLYAQVGISNTQDLALYDVEVVRTENNARRNDMVINAVIKNESSHIRFMPKVRVRLYDKRRYELETHYINDVPEDIASGKEVTLRGALWNIPQNTATVIIDIGNDKEMLMR